MNPSSHFACNNAFQLPESSENAFASECLKAFTCRAMSSAENYSTGSTFFVHADSKPITLLESLALSIFNFHSKSLSYDASKSGAEWWTQVIDSNHNIGMHWDR